jgi:hypothetical protein
MKEYCQNRLCESKAVKKVPVSVKTGFDQTRALCASCEEVYTWGVQHGVMMWEGLKIDPPPEETSGEPLFRVAYMIDVNAGDVREAAEYTHRIMTDPDSMRPVLQVIDSDGNSTQVDLSEDDPVVDSSGKAANYEAAGQYLAYQGNLVFTRPMKAGLWNARCMDASVMSKKRGDKAAYEFLLKFGDQYASDLSADQQRQWQTIKDQAALRLKGSRENTGEIRKEPVADRFTKTTVGFVCMHQEFIAGDQCDYEDDKGNTIEPTDYEYQPYNMTLRAETAQPSMHEKTCEAIEEVLEGLDVGGEQSRQFADEIRILREVISTSPAKRQFTLVINRSELSTILAALRFHQDENLRNGPDIPDEAIKDIATDSGSLKALNRNGIDQLCEKINTCDEVGAGSQRQDWVLIVTDRGTVVHVRAYDTETAAEQGLFKYLHESHNYDGQESMGVVSEWIEEQGEHLSVDIVQQDIRRVIG